MDKQPVYPSLVACTNLAVAELALQSNRIIKIITYFILSQFHWIVCGMAITFDTENVCICYGEITEYTSVCDFLNFDLTQIIFWHSRVAKVAKSTSSSYSFVYNPVHFVHKIEFIVSSGEVLEATGPLNPYVERPYLNKNDIDDLVYFTCSFEPCSISSRLTFIEKDSEDIFGLKDTIEKLKPARIVNIIPDIDLSDYSWRRVDVAWIVTPNAVVPHHLRGQYGQ